MLVKDLVGINYGFCRICIVIYGIARDNYCGLFDMFERTVLVKDCS